MPYQSKSQQRLFFAKEARGDMPKGTARRWARHTPGMKNLPERKGRTRAVVRKMRQKRRAQ